MSTRTLSKEELSLLLFLETQAVDHAGKVFSASMNERDRDIVERWHKEGFIQFGRVASEYATNGRGQWVELTDEAFALAHAERAARAKRMLEKRTYKRTSELRSES